MFAQLTHFCSMSNFYSFRKWLAELRDRLKLNPTTIDLIIRRLKDKLTTFTKVIIFFIAQLKCLSSNQGNGLVFFSFGYFIRRNYNLWIFTIFAFSNKHEICSMLIHVVMFGVLEKDQSSLYIIYKFIDSC